MLLAVENYLNTQDSSLRAVHKAISVQNRVCFVIKAEGLTLQLVGTYCQSCTVYIPTTAQQLHTKTHHHTATLLHVSALFVNLQGGVRQKKTNLANHVVDVKFSS
jgi:hypothetical protein